MTVSLTANLSLLLQVRPRREAEAEVARQPPDPRPDLTVGETVILLTSPLHPY